MFADGMAVFLESDICLPTAQYFRDQPVRGLVCAANPDR